MKTTLNPFENAKRTANGTGGFSPSVIEEMQAEISVLGSENASQAQDITDINDNLSGFKFYPIGTGIVGLISDDSAYTDANGKYVIWGTETANQLVADNPNTYKSVPSEEDTRGKAGADTATPFSSLEDINPTKLTSNAFKLRLGISQNTIVNMLPIQGYSSISLIKNDANVDFRISFVLKDGTESAETVITLSWQDISIPNNTIIMKVKGHYPSMNVGEMYYALYR